MAKFIQYDRHLHDLLSPSVDEWLPEDHLVRYIVEVIDQLDWSKLTSRYSHSGSAAYSNSHVGHLTRFPAVWEPV